MIYNLLLQIVHMLGRIFSRLIDVALESTRRFDRIDAELKAQDEKLDQILAMLVPAPIAEIVIDVYLESGEIIQGAKHVQLKDNQKFDFTLGGKDAKGAAANIDGAKSAVSMDDTGVATVTLNPDGLGGTVVAGLTGSTQMQVSITDAVNPGDTLTGKLDIVVIAGDIVALNIGTSAPVDQ